MFCSNGHIGEGGDISIIPYDILVYGFVVEHLAQEKTKLKLLHVGNIVIKSMPFVCLLLLALCGF